MSGLRPFFWNLNLIWLAAKGVHKAATHRSNGILSESEDPNSFIYIYPLPCCPLVKLPLSILPDRSAWQLPTTQSLWAPPLTCPSCRTAPRRWQISCRRQIPHIAADIYSDNHFIMLTQPGIAPQFRCRSPYSSVDVTGLVSMESLWETQWLVQKSLPHTPGWEGWCLSGENKDTWTIRHLL